jgi:hypothetical protein
MTLLAVVSSLVAGFILGAWSPKRPWWHFPVYLVLAGVPLMFGLVLLVSP